MRFSATISRHGHLNLQFEVKLNYAEYV